MLTVQKLSEKWQCAAASGMQAVVGGEQAGTWGCAHRIRDLNYGRNNKSNRKMSCLIENTLKMSFLKCEQTISHKWYRNTRVDWLIGTGKERVCVRLTTCVPDNDLLALAVSPQTLFDVFERFPTGSEDILEHRYVGDGETQRVDLRETLLIRKGRHVQTQLFERRVDRHHSLPLSHVRCCPLYFVRGITQTCAICKWFIPTFPQCL